MKNFINETQEIKSAKFQDVLSQPYSEMIRSITGKPNLNMSRLKEGVYYVHVTGCNYTGFFKIALKNSLQLTQ